MTQQASAPGLSEVLHRVAVPGGELTVAVHEAGGGATTALLLHGVTSSRKAWDLVTARLPGVRLVVPDLRGRGRSNGVGGETGMARHADDLVAVLDALGLDRVHVVGHSMGAFVGVVLAHRHPGRVDRLVLVDGGLPLDVPAGMTPDQVIAHVLGPTAERLAMRFGSVAEYHAFWRQHPAFADCWSGYLEEYFAYDLVGEEPELRPATSRAAMEGDTVDLNSGEALPAALSALAHPTRFVTVPRGLLDETPGLYADERVPGLLDGLPEVRHTRLPDLNHYTVLMSAPGADAVAGVLREELR